MEEVAVEEDDVPGLKLNLVLLQLFAGYVNPVQLGSSLLEELDDVQVPGLHRPAQGGHSPSVLDIQPGPGLHQPPAHPHLSRPTTHVEGSPALPVHSVDVGLLESLKYLRN